MGVFFRAIYYLSSLCKTAHSRCLCCPGGPPADSSRRSQLAPTLRCWAWRSTTPASLWWVRQSCLEIYALCKSLGSWACTPGATTRSPPVLRPSIPTLHACAPAGRRWARACSWGWFRWRSRCSVPSISSEFASLGEFAWGFGGTSPSVLCCSTLRCCKYCACPVSRQGRGWVDNCCASLTPWPRCACAAATHCSSCFR